MDNFAKIKLIKGGVIVFALGLIIAGLFIFNDYFHAQEVALAEQRQSLTSTGTVEATKVMAAFKVAGKLATVQVNEGSQVTRGQELAMLESQEIDSQVTQAKGAYEAAAGLANQAKEGVSLTSQQVESAIAQTEAKVAQAEIGVKDAQATYQRAAELLKGGAIAQKDMEDATNAYDLAQQKLAEAKAGLEQATSTRLNVQVAQSKYQSAQGPWVS